MKKDGSESDNYRQNEVINSAIMNIQSVSTEQMEKLNLMEYSKIPFGEISALGAAFSSVIFPLQALTQTTMDSGFQLYKAVDANNNTIRLQHMVHDGLGYATGYIENGKMATARMQEVNTIPITSKTTIPFNPVIMCMAITLLSLEHKLDDIQKTQHKILDFLRDDKRAKLKGDFDFLFDILSGYKYNWDNDTYIGNIHIKVLDIKQSAQQNIEFFYSSIEKALPRHKQIINDRFNDIEADFTDYRTAVYLFSFSSFLEVMLLRNFEEDYLESIVNKIREYNNRYREMYTTCYNCLDKSLQSSIQTNFIGALSGVTSKTGKLISKIPLINSSQIDENLIDMGSRLKDVKEKHPENVMQHFIKFKDNGSLVFIENLSSINKIYNKSVEILFDSDNLYIK